MSLGINRQNIFFDELLNDHEDYIFSCFEAIKKFPKNDYFFFFLKEKKSDLIYSKIDEIRLNYNFTDEDSLKIFDELKTHLSETTTSFSWGHDELELIFIIISEDESNLLDDPPALIGLLVHELLHSMERQRGLEDDLKRSLSISMKTFQNFADMVSNEKFKRDDLIKLFTEIGKTAMYVLKDLYVDREAIERGFGTEILKQYKSLFNLDDGLDQTGNFPEVGLSLKDIDPQNIKLDEFQLAFIVILGLLPTWLPFLRISKGYEREQALEIRSIIDQTYDQVSIISERFHHLENMYLTDFAFTRTFHTKWFSEIFSIAIDILSGGEFIIWQFSKFVIALEDYVSEQKKIETAEDNYSVLNLIIIPVLKAAYIFAKSHTLLESINNEIIDKLKSYIDDDELIEWETDYLEYTIEGLLLFVLSELVRLLREKFLDSIQNLRIYTSFILDTLQILIDIKTNIEFLEEYHVIKNLIHQFIIERDSRFQSLKILFPLESQIEGLLFEDEPAFTPDEAEEFLQIGRFYGLPKLNWVLEMGKRMAGILKLNITKALETNEPLDYQVIGLTLMSLTKDFEGITNPDLLIPIARSVLIALHCPNFLLKDIVKMYGDLLEI